MYVTKRLLERELEFTKIYREYQNADKAVREKQTLTYQVLHYFVTPHETDLIAGRIDRPGITVSPYLEENGIDKVGYGFDETFCLEQLAIIENDPSYDEEYGARVREMISFWQAENTNTKIRSRIPAEYLTLMPSDDFLNFRAALHPIYRVAGLNLDFQKLYKYGLCGLIELINDYAKNADDKARILYESMIGVLQALREVLAQYAQDTRERIMECRDSDMCIELKKMLNALENLQENPPQNFREALQLQAVYMLASRSVELGRVDDYMSDIYLKSLHEGTVTREEAIRLLDNLFSIIEEERGRDSRAIIGGFGRSNPQDADEFAMLVLDVVGRRKFNFYPQVSLRCHKGMNEDVYSRALELLGNGYPFPLLYNDDVNVPSVMNAMGVSREIAEQYSFFGCGEFMLGRLSCGTPNTALNVAKVLESTLFNGYDPLTGEVIGPHTGEYTDDVDFETLVDRFKQQLDLFCDACGSFEELVYDVCGEECSLLFASVLQNSCLERGKAILNGGLYHLGGTVETYGNTTAWDSLVAIKQVVYEQKLLSPQQLLNALKVDFEGYENERMLLKRASKFGNDDTRADEIASEMHNYLCNSIRRQNQRTRLDSFLAVIINNSMHLTLGCHCGATPDGRKANTYMSNGNNPSAGADKQGITSLIRSMTKMDTSIHACANQNLKLSPSYFESNAEGARAIISAFFELGGQQLNLSVVNQADLEAAMIHPQEYQNLLVRVGGFTARFVTLEPDLQREILQRTAY